MAVLGHTVHALIVVVDRRILIVDLKKLRNLRYRVLGVVPAAMRVEQLCLGQRRWRLVLLLIPNHLPTLLLPWPLIVMIVLILIPNSIMIRICRLMAIHFLLGIATLKLLIHRFLGQKLTLFLQAHQVSHRELHLWHVHLSRKAASHPLTPGDTILIGLSLVAILHDPIRIQHARWHRRLHRALGPAVDTLVVNRLAQARPDGAAIVRARARRLWRLQLLACDRVLGLVLGNGDAGWQLTQQLR